MAPGALKLRVPVGPPLHCGHCLYLLPVVQLQPQEHRGCYLMKSIIIKATVTMFHPIRLNPYIFMPTWVGSMPSLKLCYFILQKISCMSYPVPFVPV